MTPRRTVVPALVAALLAGLALAPEAGACSCAPAPEAERFAGSDGAVVVRLSEVIDSDPNFGGEKHVYRVLRVYKGPPSLHRRETLTLETPSDSGACGLGRGEGRRGLYLHGRPGRWNSSLCSQTTPERMRRAERRADGRAGEAAGGCSRAG
jgi:hypothetical protein